MFSCGKRNPGQKTGRIMGWRRGGALLAALGVLSLALLVVVAATPRISQADQYAQTAEVNQVNEAEQLRQATYVTPSAQPSPQPVALLAKGVSEHNASTAQRGAVVVAVSGRVTARSTQAEAAIQALRAGDTVAAGWEVVTGPESSADLEITGPARIHLGPTSSVVVTPGNVLRNRDGGSIRPALRVNVGTVLVHVLKDVVRLVQFSVETPTAVAGVRGTVFDVQVTPTSAFTSNSTSRTRVSVWEGQVVVQARNDDWLTADAEVLGAGEETVVMVDATSQPNVEPKRFNALWAERKNWLEEQKQWEKEAQKEQRVKEQEQSHRQDKDRNEQNGQKADQKSSSNSKSNSGQPESKNRKSEADSDGQTQDNSQHDKQHRSEKGDAKSSEQGANNDHRNEQAFFNSAGSKKPQREEDD